MRILGISGSLRAASYNTALLRAAAELTPDDVELEIFDGLESLPPFNEDREGEVPVEVVHLYEQINSADAVLFATPEYNGSMPGQMKHAVDWGSRPHGASPLWGKPVAVVGASVTDYGAIWAQDHLRKSLGLAGARVLDVELPVSKAPDKFDEDGVLVDLEIRDHLSEILSALVEHRGQLSKAA